MKPPCGKLRGIRLDLDVAAEDRSDESAARKALLEAERELARLTAKQAVLQEQREAIAELDPAKPEEDEEPEHIPTAETLLARIGLQEELAGWSGAIDEVLHPLERGNLKYNGDPYQLDDGGAGDREDDGSFFLLAYWLGRYHGIFPA